MEERTYTQQEVDELLKIMSEIQDKVLNDIRAEEQEKRKKAEKQAFREAIAQEEGYVQYLLEQARAYLQQQIYELEEAENTAYFRSNGDYYMGDGWYDYQWAVAAALKQVKANQATVENITFNGEGLWLGGYRSETRKAPAPQGAGGWKRKIATN